MRKVWLIRQAQVGDAERISRLAMRTYADAFGHSFTPADLAAHLTDNLSPKMFEHALAEDIILLAEVAGDTSGYVQLGRATFPEVATTDRDFELRRLYVRADAQNKGVGALLMDAALNHPVLKKAERIFLDVWEHNPGAQRFYARYGFEVIGKREFVVESGAETSCDLIMVRRSGL